MTGLPPTSRYRSQHPDDIAWRKEQARHNNRLEGIEPDPILDAFVERMESEGVPVQERIKRLKAVVKEANIKRYGRRATDQMEDEAPSTVSVSPAE